MSIENTVRVVAAFVSHNALPAAEIPLLIRSVHDSLASLGQAPAPDEAAPQEPAVPVRKSITPEHLICLEDGKKFKSLKRHLMSSYNLTPDAYRAKWGLPSDYPMVAPNYAAARSELAKSMGLGRKPKTPALKAVA